IQFLLQIDDTGEFLLFGNLRWGIFLGRQDFYGRDAMSACMIISALLLAQAGPAIGSEGVCEQREAAFQELTTGENANAIARLQAALEQTSGDPALLINLGTAYSREGRFDEAREAFRGAMESEDRYRVQLADGSWEDSRRVARLALDSLDRTAFASR